MNPKLLLYFPLFVSYLISAQPNYPCHTNGNEQLSRLLGTWQVTAKDRTSPGKYETNAGVSVISTGIQGCSISESYQGQFKKNNYAVQSVMLLTDSMELQRVYFDSEHANTMLFSGTLTSKGIELFWTRDPERKKMQVRFELTFLEENSFEWKTHLTTDYGKTWQLTHHWQYQRLTPFETNNLEHQLIKTTIDQYHEGLSNGSSDLVKNALFDGFFMYNGNYSGDITNWQAHMFLSGEDLQVWPDLFVKEAGPYTNDYDVLSVYIRGNAALVVTRDTGKNKFRQWKDEQTAWWLGKTQGQWKILGYYLRDISNP